MMKLREPIDFFQALKVAAASRLMPCRAKMISVAGPMFAGCCINTLMGALALGLKANSVETALRTSFTPRAEPPLGSSAGTAHAASRQHRSSAAKKFKVKMRKVFAPEAERSHSTIY